MTNVKNFQRKKITDLKSFRLNYATYSENYRSYRFNDQAHSKIDLISWNKHIFFTRSCLYIKIIIFLQQILQKKIKLKMSDSKNRWNIQ